MAVSSSSAQPQSKSENPLGVHQGLKREWPNIKGDNDDCKPKGETLHFPSSLSITTTTTTTTAMTTPLPFYSASMVNSITTNNDDVRSIGGVPVGVTTTTAMSALAGTVPAVLGLLPFPAAPATVPDIQSGRRDPVNPSSWMFATTADAGTPTVAYFTPLPRHHALPLPQGNDNGETSFREYQTLPIR